MRGPLVENALQRKAPEDRDFSLAFPSFCIASRPNLAVPESPVATRDAMQKPRHFPMSGAPHPTPTAPVDDRLHGPERIRIGRPRTADATGRFGARKSCRSRNSRSASRTRKGSDIRPDSESSDNRSTHGRDRPKAELEHIGMPARTQPFADCGNL